MDEMEREELNEDMRWKGRESGLVRWCWGRPALVTPVHHGNPYLPSPSAVTLPLPLL